MAADSLTLHGDSKLAVAAAVLLNATTLASVADTHRTFLSCSLDLSILAVLLQLLKLLYALLICRDGLLRDRCS